MFYLTVVNKSLILLIPLTWMVSDDRSHEENFGCPDVGVVKQHFTHEVLTTFIINARPLVPVSNDHLVIRSDPRKDGLVRFLVVGITKEETRDVVLD